MRSIHGRRAVAGLGLVGVGALAACGGSGGPASPSSSNTITIALDIPVTADAYIAGAIQRGADLAAKEANAKGVTIAGTRYTVALKVYDDNNQPAASAQNVSSAISDHAVAVIEDGLGAAVSASRSAAAGVPEIVIANGTAGLMDPQSRPSLFRVGIANDAASNLLGTYITQTSKTVAILHDDSDSGRDGSDQLTAALATAGATASSTIEVPASSATFDLQLRTIADSKAERWPSGGATSSWPRWSRRHTQPTSPCPSSPPRRGRARRCGHRGQRRHRRAALRQLAADQRGRLCVLPAVRAPSRRCRGRPH